MNQFTKLFAPYLDLTLSAFDNAKLVASVLTEAGETFQVMEAELVMGSVASSANNTTIGDESETESKRYYLVRWQQTHIVCGLINAYQASLRLIADDEVVQASQLIEVPILNMQQLQFMCMESAHFDHC
ncbi:hypothetical protein G3R49_12375 [Shewanella sp. WXL01]|uniref:hypothetical protein n=1 Tax=Shewanella sp. WXL01 TaxID=2709721 RepID=UPI0014385ABC|nr:hypothetical protein [Shewanella sp. WXL01]NKF51353.1 hypothetical protein [Shewanella sp. WXL01]